MQELWHGPDLPHAPVFHANSRGKRALAGLGVGASHFAWEGKEGQGLPGISLSGVLWLCCTFRAGMSQLLPDIFTPLLPAGHCRP